MSVRLTGPQLRYLKQIGDPTVIGRWYGREGLWACSSDEVRWLGLFVEHGLMEQETDQVFHITEAGFDFLEQHGVERAKAYRSRRRAEAKERRETSEVLRQSEAKRHLDSLDDFLDSL